MEIEDPIEFATSILNDFKEKRLQEVAELDAYIHQLPEDLDSHEIATAFHALNKLRQNTEVMAFEIARELGEIKVKMMLLRKHKKDTIQVLKDLFGVLTEEQADKLEKAIVDLRASMRGG